MFSIQGLATMYTCYKSVKVAYKYRRLLTRILYFANLAAPWSILDSSCKEEDECEITVVEEEMIVISRIPDCGTPSANNTG